MRLFNSYTNQVEEFKPIDDKEIKMYVCGPTVYNYIHIGNARPIIFFDTLRRFFEYKGYVVKYVSNFTDIDDKIINEAKIEGISEIELANKYILAYLNDTVSLGSKVDYVKPRVTEYIDKIIDFIDRLVKLGYAYVTGGDVYFDIEKVKEYGRLSNRKVEELVSGSRVKINDQKKNPSDFTLWKETKDGINFPSPWSNGRPGWHTECVAMIEDIFKGLIDIHGGGTDLMFPHHENEIAQSLAIHDNTIANYWVHNGRLNLDGEKMSKSLGNVILVKDLKVDRRAFRLMILSSYYRNIITYTDDLLNQYVTEFEKINNAYHQLHLQLDLNNLLDVHDISGEAQNILNEFVNELDNDMNTPNALTALNKLLKLINLDLRKKDNFAALVADFNAFKTMLDVFGISISIDRLKGDTRQIYNDWVIARTNKDFVKADELRKQLIELGVLNG